MPGVLIPIDKGFTLLKSKVTSSRSKSSDTLRRLWSLVEHLTRPIMKANFKALEFDLGLLIS